MIEQILIGILITILASPILWVLRMTLTARILRTLKKAYGAVVDKFRKVKAKVTNTSHKFDENYKERHGQLKVSCVGMESPISLEDVYIDVQFLEQKRASKYGSLKDIETEFRIEGHEILDLRDISSDDSGELKSSNKPMLDCNKRQDAMSVANEKPLLMILGGPGLGKSTFLRKIGLETLKGKDGKFAHKCTPVFLELKRITKASIDIKTLIINELEICGYPDSEQKITKALESGKFLILFDGLDEVPSANFEDVAREIRDFASQYCHNRFIVSSRIAVNINGFTDVEIASFEDSQIENYIKNWFLSTSSPHKFDEGLKIAEQCWQTLIAQEHRTTRVLAGNPLLLTLLCMVYTTEQNFPPNRARLYREFLTFFSENGRQRRMFVETHQQANIW